MRYMAVLFAIVALALSCVACNKGPVAPDATVSRSVYTSNPPELGVNTATEPVYIDREFSESERLVISAAFAEWNIVLNGYVRYVIEPSPWDSDDKTVWTRVQDRKQGVLVAHLESHPGDDRAGVLAFVKTLGDDTLWVYSERVGTRDLKAILMHEIGHMLGVGHIPVRNTLMFPGYNFGQTCIDKVTVLHLASAPMQQGKLDWHHMNWCDKPL